MERARVYSYTRACSIPDARIHARLKCASTLSLFSLSPRFDRRLSDLDRRDRRV